MPSVRDLNPGDRVLAPHQNNRDYCTSAIVESVRPVTSRRGRDVGLVFLTFHRTDHHGRVSSAREGAYARPTEQWDTVDNGNRNA